MPRIGEHDSLFATGAALTSTGAKLNASPDTLVEVLRWGITPTTAVSTNAVLTLRHRPTAGSTTGQTDKGTLTVQTADGIGKCLYQALADPLVVKPGQEVVVECTTAAGGASPAGVGHIFIQYIRRPFQSQTADFTGAISRTS